MITVRKVSEKIGDTKAFPDNVDIISIGRSRSNDIRLSELNKEKPKISKHHSAIIKNRNGHHFIRDLSSKNGTKVNGTMVSRMLLKDSDEIQVGDYILNFKESSDILGVKKVLIVADEKWGKRLKENHAIDGASGMETIYGSFFAAPTNALEKLSFSHKKLLEDLGKLIKSNAHRKTLLSEITDTLIKTLNLKRGYVLLKMDDTGLKPIIERGFDAEAALEVPKAGYDAVFAKGEAFCHKGNKAVCIPLKSSEKVFGLLYLEKDGGFSTEEINLLSLFSDYFARHVNLNRQNEEDKAVNHNEFAWNAEIIGNRKTLIKLQEEIKTAAKTDGNALILGETGTGKELIVRAIHSSSPQKGKPLLAINCANIPEDLLESELFGHEKGAFTGAVDRKVGKFEAASGGTLLLDEIGDISPAIQAKLLRFLQFKEFERVGGTKTIKIDVKVIGATNKNLEEGILNGRFRNDLFHRFASKINVSSLRDRKEDIPLLAYYFLDKYSNKNNAKIESISHEAIRSDVYSFGVVLYQMANSDLPFKAPLTLEKDFFQEMYKLHKYAPIPKLNSEVFPIIERCMAKNPRDRYADFAELRKELENLWGKTTDIPLPKPLIQKPFGYRELNQKGVALKHLGRPTEALVYHDRAIEDNPVFANAWNDKGVALWELQRQDEAMECFNKAIEIDHEFVHPRSNKAALLSELGQHKEALDCYDEALKIEPGFINLWRGKGDILFKLKNYNAAIQCYDEAIKINRRDSWAWYKKALVLFLLCNPDNINEPRYQEAIKCAEKALSNNPLLYVAEDLIQKIMAIIGGSKP
jgi:tetratricopeptide (TPR) repeat protein/pSer/pThr/pTyr-binding forkhead associated (FHA) protein